MSEVLDLHKALVAEEVRKAIKQERKRIIKDLQAAHLIEWDSDRYCEMCKKTNTNAWATGCVMNPVTDIIQNKGEQK